MAILFALCLLPMIGVMGIAVDVSRAFESKTSFDAANDAAALSAATQAQIVLKNGGSASAAQAAGQTAGATMFAANAARAGATIGSVPTPAVTVSVNTSTMLISSQSTYSASVPTVFGKMFGTASMAVGSTATAKLGMQKYLNISVAVDVSQSMGLAATTAGISQLQSLTPDQCAFGCHVPVPGQTNSYETIAHNANPPIQLRIDVIKSATQNMISTAQSSPGTSGYISFALYGLQVGPPNQSQVFTTFSSTLPDPNSASLTDYVGLKSRVSTMDLGNNSSTAGYGDSDLKNSLAALTNAVPTSGTGYTQTTSQQFVFLMTDGVADIYGSGCPYTHCTVPVDPAWCQAMKNKGVTVGVIYTTYLTMPTDARYQAMVAPIASQIAPNLQQCASSGWYYQATDATDIQIAIDKMFMQAKSVPGVLTQ